MKICRVADKVSIEAMGSETKGCAAAASVEAETPERAEVTDDVEVAIWSCTDACRIGGDKLYRVNH